MTMYGQHYLKDVDEETRRAVETALVPFLPALKRLDPQRADRAAVVLYDMGERGLSGQEMAAFFLYAIACPEKEMGWLLGTSNQKERLGEAMATMVLSLPREKLPVAMVLCRMHIVTMCAGVWKPAAEEEQK
jgi:hypothetical protein